MTKKMMVNTLISLFLVVTLLTGCSGGNSGVADVTAGLVAYYPLNGNANDAVGTNDGSIYGTTVTFTQDHLGNSNKAILFDGDTLSGMSLGSFTLPSTSFSIALWIKTGTSVNSYPMYCPLFDFRQETGTTFKFQINRPTALSISGNVAQNTWTHIVGTYDDTTRTASFYINAGSPLTGLKADALDSSDISGFDMGSGWVGAIDDLRFYNRVLSASEVSQLYQFHNN